MPTRQAQKLDIEKKMSAATFWDHQETAQAVIAELKALGAVLDPVESLTSQFDDAATMFEMAREEGDALLRLRDHDNSLCEACH